jgi:hypothetical protein
MVIFTAVFGATMARDSVPAGTQPFPTHLNQGPGSSVAMKFTTLEFDRPAIVEDDESEFEQDTVANKIPTKTQIIPIAERYKNNLFIHLILLGDDG